MLDGVCISCGVSILLETCSMCACCVIANVRVPCVCAALRYVIVLIMKENIATTNCWNEFRFVERCDLINKNLFAAENTFYQQYLAFYRLI